MPVPPVEKPGHATGRRVVLAVAAIFLAYSMAWPQDGTAPQTDEAAGIRERILAESGFHGGLIVQAGLQDTGLALSLAKATNVLVHGLVPDRDTLRKARQRIRDAGLYGRVSARSWRGQTLPYTDGMVNLLLVLDERVELAQDEIDRVLAPLGVAMIQRGDRLTSMNGLIHGTTPQATRSARINGSALRGSFSGRRLHGGIGGRRPAAWSRHGDASSSFLTTRTSPPVPGRGG